jgi:sulfate adenylyltransferase large subunit
MATGASTASLAVVLMDARKGLLDQTRRHSLIVSMLGVRHLLVAINKMDLVGFDQQHFAALEREYRRFAECLGECSITCVPISAKGGDNVVSRGGNMPWYRGPTLLEHLEAVDVETAACTLPFRLTVQWVNRSTSDFRGYAGRVASGTLRPGDVVRVLPSGQRSRVARIVTFDGDLTEAQAGQSVTLTMTDEIDVSRGDVIVRVANANADVGDAAADDGVIVSAELTARLLWVGAEPAVAQRSYLLKIGTTSVPARLDPPLATMDVTSGAMISVGSAAALPELNGIALLPVRLDLPVVFDRYSDNRETGGFILIDRTTNMTVAMGMIEQGSIRKPEEAGGLVNWLTRVRERPWRSLAKAVSWRITGSVDTFVLTLIITGNARISMAVGGFEIFTKIFLYYIHERVWARVSLGVKTVGTRVSNWA